jgi:hypothetical protein
MSDPIENTVYEFPAQSYQHIVTLRPLILTDRPGQPLGWFCKRAPSPVKRVQLGQAYAYLQRQSRVPRHASCTLRGTPCLCV